MGSGCCRAGEELGVSGTGASQPKFGINIVACVQLPSYRLGSCAFYEDPVPSCPYCQHDWLNEPYVCLKASVERDPYHDLQAADNLITIKLTFGGYRFSGADRADV